MVFGMLWSVIRNLLFFQVLVVPWLVLFIGAFVYVLLFPSYLRPNKPSDIQYPRIHNLHTAGAAFLLLASLEVLLSRIFLVASICAFLSGNFLLSVNHRLMFTANVWDAYYRYLGWSGFCTSVLSLSFRMVAAQRDKEQEYGLILALNLLPMSVGFAVGAFTLNFLLVPKVQERVAEFFQEFPAKQKLQQSREMVFYASLLPVIGFTNRYVGLITTLGACAFFWFASMLLYYANADTGFQGQVSYFVSTYGLAACFCSAFMQYTNFRVDASKAYSVHALLMFIAGLINVSVALIGNFTSAIRLARQHRVLTRLTNKDMHYPSRAATLMSAVSLLISTTGNKGLVPAARVGLAVGSSIGFGLSVFLKTIPKPKEYTGFFGHWVKFKDRLDGRILLIGASLSVINTYCLVYAALVLDKEKSGDFAEVVMIISESCNLLLGSFTLVYVVLFENYKFLNQLSRASIRAFHTLGRILNHTLEVVGTKLRRLYNSRLIRTMLTRIAESVAALAEAIVAWSIRMSEALRLRELYEAVVLVLERIGDWFVRLGERFLQEWDRLWWFIERRARVAMVVFQRYAKVAMTAAAAFATRARDQLKVMAKLLRPYARDAAIIARRAKESLVRAYFTALVLADKALHAVHIRKRERGMLIALALFYSSYGIQGPVATLFAAGMLLLTPKLFSLMVFRYLLGSALALTLRKPGDFMHVTASVMNGLLAVIAVFVDTDKVRQKRQANAPNNEEGPPWSARLAGTCAGVSFFALSTSFFLQRPERKFFAMLGAQMFAVAAMVVKNALWFPRGPSIVDFLAYTAFPLTVSSAFYIEGMRAVELKEMYTGLALTSMSLGINALTWFGVVYLPLVGAARA